MFCGAPETGIHKTRLFGLAFWDLLATFIAAAVLANTAFKDHYFGTVFIVLIIIGIITHKLLGINTKLNSLIFQ